MKKVISFSLWGNNPDYGSGALINAQLAGLYYPEFECWVYLHKDSVPEETIEALSKQSNVKLIFKSGDLKDLSIKPMMWRFEAIDDPEVEIMLSRDTDTRILQREKVAVDEWIKSGKKFHIMRDHPHHTFKILGGMFGSRKLNGINWSKLANDYPRTGDRDYDQKFLEEKIYPAIKNDSVIHTSFQHYHGEDYKPFPTQFSNDHRFVGEYIYKDESRSIQHVIALLQSSNLNLPQLHLNQSLINSPLFQ